MTKYNHYFSSFLGGELDPKALGRSDTDLYKASAETIDNFVVQVQGGVARRPGFKHVEAARSASGCRLIPFIHSSGAKYMLEFSDNKFRIFKDGAKVGAPTEVVTPWDIDTVGELDFAQSGDTMYVTHGDTPPQKITRSSDTSWNVTNVVYDCAPMYPLDDSTYGRTEELGNTAVQVTALSFNFLNATATLTVGASLFSADDVGKYMRIKNFTADPDSEANASITTSQTTIDVKASDGAVSTGTSEYQVVAYDASGVPDSSHRSYIRKDHLYVKLPAVTTSTRTTPYSSIVSTTSRTYSGSTGSSTSLAPTVATTETSTYTGSAITAETVTVTGNETESWGLVKLNGYISATQMTVTVLRPLSSQNFHSSQQWQMSRFGDNTGYPKKVAFYEGRCFFANHGDSTNVLIGSKTGSITDFENGEGSEGTLTAASALDFTLSEITSIQWLQPSQKLIIGATNGVYSLSGSNQAGINPLVPPIFRKIASSECSTVKPIFTQNTTFFTHSNSKKVGALIYRPGEFSGFDFKDMSLLSEHLISGGIKEWALKDGVIWSITGTGLLRGLTYNEEQGINAWHKHTLTGTVNSIQSLDDDDLYVAIIRTINSSSTQYIETLAPNIQDVNKEDVICVDSAFTYDSTATSVITGLGHLEGETVDILADGAAHPQLTVSSGQVTLTADASVVQLGIPYVSQLTTVEVVGGNRRGSSEARISRIHEVGVKFLSTNGAIVTLSGSPELEHTFNENQIFGQGADLFTGTKVESLNSGSVLNPTVTVKSSAALPISILGISADTYVSET